MMLDLQKASMAKRISAFLFDGIMLCVLAVGIALLLSSLLGYDDYSQQLNSAYEQYEQQYGVTFQMTEEQYLAMTPEDLEQYEAAYAALIADSEAMYAYNMVLNLTLLVITLALLLAFLALEFGVPLLFGDGRTLGKRIFGLAVMRTDGVRVTPLQLFIRTILGKYTIETMIPVLILIMLYFNVVGLTGTLLLLGLLLGQVILLIVNRNNSMIHDLLAGTVAVDHASQMIFPDTQQLLAYKKKLHADSVATRRD